MIVQVNAQNLKNEVNKCTDNLNDFRTNRQNIEKTVSEIAHIWKEEEYENFKSKLDIFLDELKEFEDQIDSYNNFVKGYVAIEEALDSDYGSKKINIE